MSMFAALRPGPRYVAMLILACAFVAVTYGVIGAKARHDMAALQQKVCAAELRALRARNVFTERFLLPESPCLALQIISEGK